MMSHIFALFILGALSCAARAGDRRSVDPDVASLVQAESMLVRARLLSTSFYPGSYRRPGDFSQRQLRGLSAQRLDLKRFRFDGADLRGADFYKADLRQADLRGADLRDAVLISTRLEGAYFDKRTRLPISEGEARARGMVPWPSE